MYCRKCGKQIDYDAPICKECEQAELFSATQTPPIQPVGDRKEGFGGSLTATILGSVAFFIGLIAMTMATVALEEYAYGYNDIFELISVCFVISFLSLGMAIPGLILGIKGMKRFFKAKNEGRIKPIATLVCGIVGLAMSAISMFYFLITFLMYSII